MLEAEIHRQRGDVRLGYLAQASFIKYLVERHGLERFRRLFASDPAAGGEIYGQELAELDEESAPRAPQLDPAAAAGGRDDRLKP